MVSSQDPKKKDQPKKRSILGLLFNPRIDREIEPLKDAARLFARGLALVFASYRLFPKNHPALEDSSVRLTVMDVFRTAYSGLKFTKEGVPQILLFTAVSGCILFTALFVVTFLLSLLMGSAHAQVFQSPAPEDWAIKWVNFLFLGEQIQNTGAVVQPPAGNAMQVALGSALSFYSTAVLALAGFLLLYHLVFMVAETAHSGKPMGRANQIWAPIRLVFAIGMLVPIGTGGTGATVVGYNTAQYLTMQIARWGSGLASNVWEVFVTRLNTASSFGVCTDANNGSPSCMRVAADARNTVKALIAMEACAYTVNSQIGESGVNGATGWSYGVGFWPDDPDIARVRVLSQITNNTAEGKHLLSLISTTANDFGNISTAELCGGYDLPRVFDDANNPFRTVYAAQRAAFVALFPRIHQYVVTYVPDMIKSSGGESYYTTEQRRVALNTISDAYFQDLTSRVAGALGTANTEAARLLTDRLGGTFLQTGWLTAGSWFNLVARLMSQKSDSIRNGKPLLMQPVLGTEGAKTCGGPGGLNGVACDAMTAYTKFMDATDDETQFQAATTTPTRDRVLSYGIEDLFSTSSITSLNPINLVFMAIDRIGIMFNLWNEQGDLTLQFGATTNPFAELAAWGQNMVEAGSSMIGWGMVAHTGGALIGKIKFLGWAGKVGEVVGGLLMTVASLFFIVGLTFGFLVPLYPFYRFFFGSLQWIMMVFEGVVLAPLFALAHVNPFGDGLPGQYGRYGYSVWIQILLRPAMMIFGLIAGYLLFTAAIHFLNDAFMIAARGTGAFTGGNQVIAKIFYLITYFAVVLILANQCFSTIGLFPQQILAWLGLPGAKEEPIGDTGRVTMAAGYLSKEGVGHLTKVASTPGKMISSIGAKK